MNRHLLAAVVVPLALAISSNPVFAEANIDAALDHFAAGETQLGLNELELLIETSDDPTEVSHLKYLVARTFEQAGRCEEAVAQFEDLEASAADDDPWLARARFGRAACLLEIGEQAEALEIYSQEARRILDPAHRETIVQSVLTFARESAETTWNRPMRNQSRALQLYRVVREMEPEEADFDEADHYVAWLESNTERLAERIVSNPSGPWACADRFRLAALNSDTRLFGFVARNCPSEQAYPAAQALADQSPVEALSVIPDVLDRFADDDGEKSPVEYALLSEHLLLTIGYGYSEEAMDLVGPAIERERGIDADLTLEAAAALASSGHPDKARTLWTRVFEESGRQTAIERARSEWADQRYLESEMAFQVGEVQLAIDVLDQLTDEDPTLREDCAVQIARMRAASGQYEEAERRLVAVDTSEAKHLLLSLLEEQGRLDEALLLRRDLGLGASSEHLEVFVPGTFDRTESPHLSVVTDRLSEIELRIHRITFEDYVRSMATTEGVENLDVDLIAPDESRQVDLSAPTIDADSPPGPTRQDIPLDFLDTGVYAIEVVGETQRALAIVHISDIQVLVRTVGGDTVVVVLDPSAASTVPGASVVVTNGSEIVTESVTDSEGIARFDLSESRLEFLAIHGDHVAWSKLDGQGLSGAADARTAQDETRDGWLRVDRIHPRAGEDVSVVGFFVEGTAPRHPMNGEVELQLFARETALLSRTVPVVDGVLEYTFALAETTPTGHYSIRSNDVQASFWVSSSVRRRRNIVLRQESPVRRGEAASVIAEVRGIDGEVEMGVALWGDLSDGEGRRLLGRTDRNGELGLTIDTDPALANREVEVEERHLTVEVVQAGSFSVHGPALVDRGEPARIELRWPDVEAGSAVATFWRNADLTADGRLERVPNRAIVPTWWPGLTRLPPATTAGSTAEFVDGVATLDLPTDEAGSYRVRLQALTETGTVASVEHSYRVAELAMEPHLSIGIEPDGARPIALDYQDVLTVQADSPDQVPMLLTLEGTGVLWQRVVHAGETVELELPPELLGEGRIVLSSRTGQHSLAIEVTRELAIEAELDTGSAPELRLSVTDGDGAPADLAVFVSLLPIPQERSPSSYPVFSTTAALLAANTGRSLISGASAQVMTISADVLALQAERELALLEATAFQMDDFEQMYEGDSLNMAFGASGSGRGGGGFGRSQDSMGLSVGTGEPGVVDPRYRPAAWALVPTEDDGTATVAVDAEALARGWYRLTTVAFDSRSAAAGTGFVTQQSVFVDARPFQDPVENQVARHTQAAHTLLIAQDESVTLDTSAYDWVEIQVAGPDIDQVTSLFLEPLEVHDNERDFFSEQLFTLDWIRSLRASRDEEPGDQLWRWISESRSRDALSSVSLFHRTPEQLQNQLERLAEERMAERAMTVLAIARQRPDSGQVGAALLRLIRDGALANPEVAGAVALASVIVEGSQRREELLPALEEVLAAGPLLSRTFAVEALARLGEPVPVDLHSLYDEVPRNSGARENAEVMMGAITRALILSDETVTGHGRLQIALDGVDMAPSDSRHTRLIVAGATLTLTAQDSPLSVRVVGIDEDRPAPLASRVERTLERHGVWYRGTEITPTVPVEAAEVVTSGRRMRVTYQLDVDCRATCVLVDRLPPGTQLASGSISGMSLVRRDGQQIVLQGNGSRVTYTIHVIQPEAADSERANWAAPLLFRSGTRTLLSAGEDAVFQSSASSTEEAMRLAGLPILPSESRDLTESERLNLGLAMYERAGGDLDAMRESITLLLPLLRSAELNTNQVIAAGGSAFRAAIAVEDDALIRDLFAMLEARAPRVEITESELTAVVNSFVEDGDVEYGLRAWTALLNLRFLREVGAGERMLASGLISDGIRLVHNLTRAYPDIPAVTDSVFNLPQMFLSQAERQSDTPEGRFKARRYRATANRWLGEYMARYGTESRAAQAALLHLNIARDLEAWGRLVHQGLRYELRFGGSEFTDSFVFLAAFGLQSLGEFDEARRLYSRVVDEEFHGQVSQERDRAQLALARLDHAEGRLEQAIEGYRAVSEQFPDAASALALLESPELRAPQIVEGRPEQDIVLPIKVRGVNQITVWAYPVDLEQMFLRERQIQASDNVALAGIEPALHMEHELPLNYGSLAEHSVSLDLPEQGAYLVLVSSETARTSSLVVVSELQIDLVEDPATSVLRVSVTDQRGVPQEAATVRVASRGSVSSEQTDLRGIAHIYGDRTTHVVARVGDSFAVYRGAEIDSYAMPSQVYSGAVVGGRFDDALFGGTNDRVQELIEDNEMSYQHNVWGNRRSVSNFELE